MEAARLRFSEVHERFAGTYVYVLGTEWVKVSITHVYFILPRKCVIQTGHPKTSLASSFVVVVFLLNFFPPRTPKNYGFA